MDRDQIKVLATGSANGMIEELFTGITKINGKYGPFDMLLCVGDLFGDADEDVVNAVLSGSIHVPIMTYFMHGRYPLPTAIKKRIDDNHGESYAEILFDSTSNSYSLLIIDTKGAHGIMTTINNVTVAFTSGILASPAPALPTDVDILLTHEWPKDIQLLSSHKIPQNIVGSKFVADLAMYVRPRYHIAASEGIFLQREPYKNIGAEEEKRVLQLLHDDKKDLREKQSGDEGMKTRRRFDHATWFVGLAEVRNTHKEKWYYGFNLVPLSQLDSSADILRHPPNTTECPYLLKQSETPATGKKRDGGREEGGPGNYLWSNDMQAKEFDNKRRKKTLPPENYVCNICKTPGHWIKECPESKSIKVPGPEYTCKACGEKGHYLSDCKNRKITAKRDTSACWFCLSNPRTAKQLIVTVASEIYLTLAKGSLIDTTDSSMSLVPGGGHGLLISIAHHGTFREAPLEIQVNLLNELEKFKSGIRRMYEHYGAGMVAFELSKPGSHQHAHMQVVPIPSKYDSNKVRMAFINEAESSGWTFKQLPSVLPQSFFKVDLPDGSSLFYELKQNEIFDAQFGRKVLAHLLGAPERADWRACVTNEEREREDTNRFREIFREYDPIEYLKF
ncbi:2761_t:CDS:10 [Paraglomus brasilianum]|uniref:2761_t:CDS:1 n=1 Tax=Paraglomus brasilianum TaxID=144538 RepID=A0A9N9AC01_9GLOM|nr:2761_t:CDS:10 [Paraglomus brasilianum]